MMVGVKVLIGPGMDTKDNLYTCKEYAERGNLGVSPIHYAYNKTVSLRFPRFTPGGIKVRGRRKFRMDTCP